MVMFVVRTGGPVKITAPHGQYRNNASTIDRVVRVGGRDPPVPAIDTPPRRGTTAG
ncbi:MAG: hypothetical protein H6977_15785 [Gammaproteobacteria bacterium]|nr:hypothetical protein [Gammaproteobacteria bacterium]